MDNSEWLNDIGKDILKIQEIALKCKEPFQQKCFEILLLNILQGPSSFAEPVRIPSPSGAHVVQNKNPFSIEYQKFLEHFNLSHEKIANIMDFDTGKIFTKKFGSSLSSRQRLLASLIAIRHCATEGNLIIPKEELRQKCEEFSSYDSKNFVTNMKNTTTNNRTMVFDDKGDSWKVTPLGEEYIKEMINQILEP